ncbi:MAG: helix-turn-helix domain-containing protein [Acidobacteriaceae bacterium]
MRELSAGEVDVFLSSWREWEAELPPSLAHESPQVLVRLLWLSARPNGIFQMELMKRLGWNQSRVSKLVGKLAAAGWITLHRSEQQRATIAGKGKRVLESFMAMLQELARAPSPARIRRRHRGIQTVKGQEAFDLESLLDPE